MYPDTVLGLLSAALSKTGAAVQRARMILPRRPDGVQTTLKALTTFLEEHRIDTLFYDRLFEPSVPLALRRWRPELRQFIFLERTDPVNPGWLRRVLPAQPPAQSSREFLLEELPDGNLRSNFLHLQPRPLVAALGEFEPDLKVYIIGPNKPVLFTRQFVLGDFACRYNRPVHRNPRFRDLDLTHPALSPLGCSFCSDPHGVSPDPLVSVQDLRTQIERYLDLDPVREIIVVDENIIPRILALAQTLPPTPVTRSIGLRGRVAQILAHRRDLEESLAVAQEKNYRIMLYLTGFENFSNRILELYNRDVAQEDILECIRYLADLRRRFPSSLHLPPTHGFILFNPWVSDEDVLCNARHFILYDFVTMFSRNAVVTKLQLTPELPLYHLAKKQGLLTEGYPDREQDSGWFLGYRPEHPWSFERREMADVYSECVRLFEQVESPTRSEPYSQNLFPNYVLLLAHRKMLGQMTQAQIEDRDVLLRQPETFERLRVYRERAAEWLRRNDPLGDAYFLEGLGLQGDGPRPAPRAEFRPSLRVLRQHLWSGRKSSEEILFDTGRKDVLILQIPGGRAQEVLDRYRGYPVKVVGEPTWDLLSEEESDRSVEKRVDIFVALREEDLSIADSIEAATRDPRRSEEVGRRLGYPECCVKAFVSYPPTASNTFLLYQSVLNSDGKFARPLNIRLPYVPCTLHCAKAIDHASVVLDWHRRHERAFARRLLRLLGLPTLLFNKGLRVLFHGARREGQSLRYDAVTAFDASPDLLLRKAFRRNILEPLSSGDSVVNERFVLRILRGGQTVREFEKAIPGINPLLIFE